MNGSLLEFKNWSVTFSTFQGDVPAVRDVCIDINTHESVGLVGESGSGKSVISLSAMGLLPNNLKSTSGDVLLEKKSLHTWILSHPQAQQNQQKIRGCKISMIFQDALNSLSPTMTVGEHLLEALQLHFPKWTFQQRHQQAIEWLNKVGLSDPPRQMQQYPHQISGGMAQRVMIALALLPRPQLVIADEPTTALDATVQAQILKLIKDLQQEYKMSLLLISHDLAVVAENCDRLYVMKQGQVIESGTTAQIWTSPQQDYTKELLSLHAAGNNRSATMTAVSANGINSVESTNIVYESSLQSATHLEVQGLNKSFYTQKTAVPVLKNISLNLQQGQTVALVGESGSGKSTLAKVLMGIEKPDSGSVSYLGATAEKKDFLSMPLWQKASVLQMIFQDTSGALNPRRKILDIVAEPLQILFSEL
ncbi:MAG: ATP-binding cassette domain-containing protein, partial [Pseudobdellovibrionaceae bacterium]